MNEAIMKALGFLNDIEVRGQRNCVLLVAAINALKPLQTAQLVSPANKVNDDKGRDGE